MAPHQFHSARAYLSINGSWAVDDKNIGNSIYCKLRIASETYLIWSRIHFIENNMREIRIVDVSVHRGIQRCSVFKLKYLEK